jgi:gluconokinase
VTATEMRGSVVVMGVAGCGKSSLAAAVAQAEGAPLVEGDEYHSAENREKMRRGIALTDADRKGWLRTLGEKLRANPGGVVLTCSALKRAYRDLLREAEPRLRFVFMDIGREDARARVASRGSAHYFSPTLVDSQFAVLEPPMGEPRVLRLDAMAPLARLRDDVCAWLRAEASG